MARCTFVIQNGHRTGKTCLRTALENDVFCRGHRREVVNSDRVSEKARVDRQEHHKAAAGKELLRVAGVSTIELLESGAISIEDLSWEELVGGFVYIRDPETNLIVDKRTPALIPRSFYLQVTKALTTQADQLFRDQFEFAMKALADLVTGQRTPARERLMAAQYIIERVIGKIPERREIDLSTTVFQELATSGSLLVDLEENKDLVIDAEVLDD